jgi:hypothetical protein
MKDSSPANKKRKLKKKKKRKSEVVEIVEQELTLLSEPKNFWLLLDMQQWPKEVEHILFAGIKETLVNSVQYKRFANFATMLSLNMQVV